MMESSLTLFCKLQCCFVSLISLKCHPGGVLHSVLFYNRGNVLKLHGRQPNKKD